MQGCIGRHVRRAYEADAGRATKCLLPPPTHLAGALRLALQHARHYSGAGAGAAGQGAAGAALPHMHAHVARGKDLHKLCRGGNNGQRIDQ